MKPESSQVTTSPVKCPLCGSTDSTLLESVPVAHLCHEYQRQLGVDPSREFPDDMDVIDYTVCRQCGLKFFDPVIAGSSDFYSELSARPGYYWGQRWEFEQSKPIVAGFQCVVDVGCGDGHFLSLIENPSRIGLEYNPAAVAKAREKGLCVQQGDLSCLEPDSADAITLFQVLEHVADPVKVVQQALVVLRNGGCLIIAVPNNDGYMGKSIQDPLNAAPHHPLGWGAKSLEYLSDLFDLRLDRLEEEPLGPAHLFGYRKTLITNAIGRLMIRPIPRMRLTPLSVFVRKSANALTMLSMRIKPRPGHSPAVGHSLLAVYFKNAP